MNQLVPASSGDNVPAGAGAAAADLINVGQDTHQLVTFYLAERMLALPVLDVLEILTPEKIHHVPLAAAEVAGSINLRGRIVTVIDMRKRLGLPDFNLKEGEERFCVTVENRNELYGLLVDSVGDVMDVPADLYDKVPPTLDQHWRELAVGVYRLKGELLVRLDMERLFVAEGEGTLPKV